MRPLFNRMLVLACASLVSAPLAAADYVFDPLHCQVLFFANHLGFSHPMGRFPALSGGFSYDAEQPQASKVEVSIDIESLYLGDAAFEKKVLSDDFFDARQFPTMHFVSTRVAPGDDHRLRIEGQLTLHGVTRPVSFDATVNRVGRHSFSLKYVAGFSATTTIKRSDFGMQRLLPAVGDEVEVRLEIEGLRQ